MVFGQAARAFSRKFSTTAVVKSGWQQHGIPGSNVPFDISNVYKMTALFTVFMSSAVSAPFLLVRHQLLKK